MSNIHYMNIIMSDLLHQFFILKFQFWHIVKNPPVSIIRFFFEGVLFPPMKAVSQRGYLTIQQHMKGAKNFQISNSFAN